MRLIGRHFTVTTRTARPPKAHLFVTPIDFIEVIPFLACATVVKKYPTVASILDFLRKKPAR